MGVRHVLQPHFFSVIIHFYYLNITNVGQIRCIQLFKDTFLKLFLFSFSCELQVKYSNTDKYIYQDFMGHQVSLASLFSHVLR